MSKLITEVDLVKEALVTASKELINKREIIAAMAMHGLLTQMEKPNLPALMKLSVMCADELIAELNKKPD